MGLRRTRFRIPDHCGTRVHTHLHLHGHRGGGAVRFIQPQGDAGRIVDVLVSYDHSDGICPNVLATGPRSIGSWTGVSRIKIAVQV